jgi:hypothetical protein
MCAINTMDPVTQYIIGAVITTLLLISEYLGTSAKTENKSVYNLVTRILINALNTLQQGSGGTVIANPVPTPPTMPVLIAHVNSDHNSSSTHAGNSPANEL